MKKALTYFTATVWFTVDSPTGDYVTRKCINTDTDTDAYKVAESLHKRGYYDIRIRKAYSNYYINYKPATEHELPA